jgi:hypothetical protein
MKRNDESLKAIIAYLRARMDKGAKEPGQTQVLARCITDLCRVRRSHDPAKIWAAVDRVARAFLRQKEK